MPKPAYLRTRFSGFFSALWPWLSPFLLCFFGLSSGGRTSSSVKASSMHSSTVPPSSMHCSVTMMGSIDRLPVPCPRTDTGTASDADLFFPISACLSAS